MPSAEQLRSRLLKKLSELFQLDQPDLDFGFYRIMHAKSAEVHDFITTDLLKIVADAFADMDEVRKAELQAAYDNTLREAKEEYGITEPEKTPKVQKAKAALDAAKDTAGAEAEVYDHLYRFFERYYDDGDFISRRYYTRETSGKAAPFAVPYNGEEVKLHWANADQYYIKSAEYFSNFTFDLGQAKEVRAAQGSLPMGGIEAPRMVHFRVVEATEGEHGNVKASEANKRFFILHAEDPVALSETGELVVNFEYRPDPEKTGQENTWRDKRNAEAVATILEHLENMAATGGEHEKQIEQYLRLFKIPAPTEKDKKRPVLAKYVNQYTARNTMDYFIHKDLGGFLRRELDFYIKNEVMRLDDIENADAPAVESYLATIKVLRKIAGKLIDFLAQLEDFQKKLWLKKKFIVETNYCITLDRVPEELYAEVAACDGQCDEWIKLFAIDEIQADLHSPGFSRPLTVEFLKANNKLVLDTRFFDNSFKARLVASIENFDEQCDGLLIHSENFQALNLLQERYREQVKCTYIDPPYNTAASEIIYKNSYKHSSWLSLLENRVSLNSQLMNKTGLLEIAIDDAEFNRLQGLLDQVMGEENHVANIAILHNPKGREQNFVSDAHEYTLLYAKNKKNLSMSRLPLTDDNITAKYPKQDNVGRFRELPLRRRGTAPFREDRPYMYFPFIVDTQKNTIRVIPRDEYEQIYDGSSFNDFFLDKLAKRYAKKGFTSILPIREDGQLGRWRWGYDRCIRECESGVFLVRGRTEPTIYHKDYVVDSMLPKSLWFDVRYDASTKGTNLLKEVIPNNDFDYPKSVYAVEDFVILGTSQGELVIDFFGGSGTTGHAIINLCRRGLHRNYILVEMGKHFETVLTPRLKRLIYSDDWKKGHPASRHTGISHCCKYLRLESYEDTLNNLRFDDGPSNSALLKNTSLKEDYMLRYLLDVETRGSQSLLNIDAFVDPTGYTLEVKKPGTDEYVTRAVDLIETFNYLIGLRVVHYAAPRECTATFKRVEDPEMPQGRQTKLVLDGTLQPIENPQSAISNPVWWFRTVEGWTPADPANPNNGRREKVLIVWRTLTGDIEQDNLMLDEWFQKNRISTRDFEFDTIYVNGSNNLPNLKLDDENWKVRLIEEEFMKRMWNMEVI
jgi:adenine-specific DNA-methyltransferase